MEQYNRMDTLYGSSQNHEEDEDGNEEIESDSYSIFGEKHITRARTAPARPLTDLEDFKRSKEFLLLEQSIICGTQLIQKNYRKFDLDSYEGQKICKKYLQITEKLCEAFHVQTTSRTYRNGFSKAYKILYKEGSLCYLTEILDSAQEGFPYLWVNGEKYVFSPGVLDAGKKLLKNFFKMQHIIRNQYGRTVQENVNISSQVIKQEINNCLEEFDNSWARFEELYVLELMFIEADSRRYIQKAIELEQELTSIEIREKIKGKIFFTSEEYTGIRKKLCKVICQINSVANEQGKGRDDLDFEILQEAEGIIRRVTKDQSKVVRMLAEKIRNNFMKLRQLFRKYEQNIEMVDPQLKNNFDLVEVLTEYETLWGKGKKYFLDPKKCTYLIHFSHIIEATAEKHTEFQEQIECRDADIFMSIPSLMILKLLDNNDKNICKYFLPQLFDEKNKLNTIYQHLQIEFKKWKSGNNHEQQYHYHNIVEKILLGINLTQDLQDILKDYQKDVDYMVNQIKNLAMELQRNQPCEWNSFMDAALT